MKKIILSLTLLVVCMAVKAQMTRWIMQPGYDKIYIASGAPLLISDSLDTSSIWNFKGQKLAVTKDDIHPFREGLAVTTQKKTDNITGFFDVQGKFTPLKGYTVTYGEPYFKNGYLLVRSNGRYCFLNELGEEVNLGYYADMYPFNNGYATCFTYVQPDKLKDPYYEFITSNLQRVILSYNNKVFDKTDVEFLSSVNDEGKAIAIIKHKVYFYDIKSSQLEPVFSNKAETNIKRQVEVKGEIHEYLLNMNDSIIIRGKGGSKTDFVRFNFDKYLRPTKIYFADRTEVYKEKEIVEKKYTSPFSSLKTRGNKLGLSYDGKPVLPAQFDAVGFFLNDFAVVLKDDKWGMLTFDPSLSYRLVMHNDKDISFRHKDVTTTIKLELPAIISANKCRFDVEEGHGCVIDKISLETKNTENGNYVQYKCNLTIPASLPDVLTEIEYPVQITYDGLKYPVVPIKTKAWHYKYINVDLDNSETTLEQGNVSFTINISADKQPGESDYPFEVEIETDSLQTELSKISETRYKCKLYSLAEGINNVNINILEDGCPPSMFPFEITYIKPVKKTRNKAEVKEEVKIEKKVKAKEPANIEGPILPI